MPDPEPEWMTWGEAIPRLLKGEILKRRDDSKIFMSQSRIFGELPVDCGRAGRVFLVNFDTVDRFRPWTPPEVK